MRTLGAIGGAMGAVLALLASLCLAFMVLITVADVVLRAIDPDWRIFGMLDYVEFSLAWMIYLAIPLAVVERRKIAVDLAESWLGGGGRKALRALAVVATLAAFVLIATQIVTPALEIREWGETTLDLRLPKFWYWIAIWVGIAASIVAVLISAPAEIAEDRPHEPA